MAQLNKRVRTPAPLTHEGGPAARHVTPLAALRRTVSACLLWEDTFYEAGASVADRIAALVPLCNPVDVAMLAAEARTRLHLRHAPLLLLAELSAIARGRDDSLVASTLADVIQRPDELTEFLAIYWRNGRKPVSRQVRLGFAAAFHKFDPYQFAKYDRDGKIKLRDALRIARPKPKNEEQSLLFKAVKDRSLPSPDTWEVALSGGADKKLAFTKLLEEGRLGYLALLRNLRNMADAGVDPMLVESALRARKGANRVLPFRYVAAARAAPRFERAIDDALLDCIGTSEPLPGRTIVLVDVSGSMNAALSSRSDMKRMDAAAALASVINGDIRVFSFSAGINGYRYPRAQRVALEVPPRRGMAGVDAIIGSQSHGGTMLGQAVEEVNQEPHDRLIVITDEQTADRVPDPVAPRAYLINVATYQNGVGYGPKWVHIDGFSESVLRFIREIEDQPDR